MFLNIMEYEYSCIIYNMRRKKLYYVPGLISLISLPILVFCLFPKGQKQLTVIRMLLPSDKISNDRYVIRYSRDYVLNSIKSKKIIEVNLNKYGPFHETDSLENKFKFISKQLDSLYMSNDTTTVIKVDLGDSSTYGQFVWLVNQTLIRQWKRWAYVDNCFYFLNNKLEPIKRDTSVIKEVYL
jgi:hypothetical protein